MATEDALKQLINYINTSENVKDECVCDGDGRYDTWRSTQFDTLIENANKSLDSHNNVIDSFYELLSYIAESNVFDECDVDGETYQSIEFSSLIESAQSSLSSFIPMVNGMKIN